MPSYITQQMLEDRVGSNLLAKFVKYDNGTDEYETSVLQVILRSEARVNGYIESRYTIPVPTSGLIEEFCLAIAEWELYRRGSGAVPDKIRTAYEDTLKDLRDIAKGVMDIGGTVEPTESEESGGIEIMSATGLFDADSMENAGW